jgi:hypothetical protein
MEEILADLKGISCQNEFPHRKISFYVTTVLFVLKTQDISRMLKLAPHTLPELHQHSPTTCSANDRSFEHFCD